MTYPYPLLGASMGGFFGARAECKIRDWEVPVVICDFLSQYTTVCVLIGAWRFHTAMRIRHDKVDPRSLERWLDQLTLADLYKPATWRRLNTLCWVATGQETLLPVRARFDPDSRSSNIALSYLQSSVVLPYFLADLVVARILTGRTPRIERAVRFVPVGKRRGLKSLRIPGAGKIDPYRDDFFKRLVELREKTKHARYLKSEQARRSARQSLKILSSATSYGINAESNPEDLSTAIRADAWGIDHFLARTRHPETPGEYAYPPLAGIITAGGRLLLAMLECEITRRGGVWANADTDAMAIVATRLGGLIRCPGGNHRTADGDEAILALSHAQVMEIVEGFRRLNPYDPRVIDRSILEVEDVNYDEHGQVRSVWAYCLAAKRYCTYLKVGGQRELTEKYSEHGLGHLADPRDPNDRAEPWSKVVWEWILTTRFDAEPPALPYWALRPAVTQRTISTPTILDLFDERLRMRAFGFVNHVQLHGHEQDRLAGGRTRFDLVAPYDKDPRVWSRQTWIDTESAVEHRIATLAPDGLVPDSDRVLVRSYADILDSYARKAEPKSLGPDRQVCNAASRGVLQRRHVRNLLITHRGKESNPLEPTQPPTSDRATLDDRDARIWQQIVLPVLRGLPVATVAEASGLPRHAIKDIRTRQTPRHGRLQLLIHAITPIARQHLHEAGESAATDDLTALAQYRDLGATCSRNPSSAGSSGSLGRV